MILSLIPVYFQLTHVGATYTIDAKKMKEYVDRIMTSVVITMYYKTKGLNLDIDKADEFIDLFEEEEVEDNGENEIELFRDDITEEETKIVLMERVQ